MPTGACRTMHAVQKVLPAVWCYIKVGVATAVALAGVMLRGGYWQYFTVRISQPVDGTRDQTVKLFVS
jgi:hypothetical protein